MTRFNVAWHNFDITGYCAGIKMQLWVYMKLRNLYGNMPEFMEV